MSSPVWVPPAGESEIGTFLLEENADPSLVPGILADPVDPSTGEYLSISRGFDPTDAAVLTALSIVRASGSAVMQTGQQFHKATHVTPELANFFQQETEFALRDLIGSSQIRLDAVTVVTIDTEAYLRIEYFNLARQEDRKPLLALGALMQEAA